MDNFDVLEKLVAEQEKKTDLPSGLTGSQIRENFNRIKSGANLKKPKDVVPVIDGSQVGQGDINLDTSLNTSKRDSSIAKIQSTPAETQSQSVDIFGEVLKGASPEDQDLVKQLLSQADSLTGGTFTKLGEGALGGLLGAQVDQAKRKKETARLQEKAGLPELESEFAAITSEYNTLEAVRNSRLINEAGGKTTISKRTLQNRQNAIQRQYGLQVADNRINELAVAGKINAATQLIDAKMDLKYGDLEAEIDLYTSQLNAIKPFMDKEQEKLAEQRQFALQQASNVINDARNRDKELELAKAQAIKNAQDRGASIQQIAQIQDAKNLQEVAATGFTTSALEQAQLQGQRLSNLKLSNELSDSTGQVGGTIGAISTLLGVKPDRLIETPDGQNAFVFKDEEPEKADKELVNQMFSAIGVVDRLEQQYNNAVGSEYSGFGSGVLSRIKGLKRAVGSFLGTNQEFTAYDNLRDSNLAIISRGLKGEKGNLSDQDIKRAKKALPGRFSSPLEAQRAFDDLRSQVRDSISLRGDIKPINEILLENLSDEQMAELQAEGLI